MALPTWVAAGAFSGSQAAITPALPAGIQSGDILLLAVETRAGQSVTIANSNGGDWSLATSPNIAAQDTGGTTTGTRLTLFLSRYDGSQGDPTTSDSGDHQTGCIVAFRGVVASGDPHEAPNGGTKTSASTTVSASGTTTTGADRLAVVVVSRENDAAGGFFSNWANSDLANLTPRADDGTASGNGGGLAIVTGEKAAAGTYGATTADIAASVVNAFITIALIPAVAGGGGTLDCQPGAFAVTGSTAQTFADQPQPREDVWPTLPTPNTANFLDDFDSTLNARWTAVASGSGSSSLTDNYLELVSPASSASFVYHQLDKAVSQLWLICLSLERTSGTGASEAILLVNGASAPAADTQANIDAKTLAATGIGSATPAPVHPWYFSSGGTQTWYDRTNGIWTTSYPGDSATAVPVARLDDYYVVGIEVDATNQRWRKHYYAQSFPTAGTYTFEQGWRLFTSTDWVAWTDTRSNADVWLVLGRPVNDGAAAWRYRVEWVRYGEARSGRVYDGWNASKELVSDAHRIRHSYSYDGKAWLNSVDGWALDNITNETQLQEPWVVHDGDGTDWMFFHSKLSTGSTTIGVASAPHHAGLPDTWSAFTRSASNPLLTVGTSGSFDDSQIRAPVVVKDELEADSNKRWKMLYTATKASDGVFRIGYATAPSPDGTWTKQGMVIDAGTGSDPDAGGACWCVPVRLVTGWEVWYEAADGVGAFDGERSLMRATGTDLGSLTKDSTIYLTLPAGGATTLTAALNTAPGRTVTVADTTDFARNDMIFIDQDTTNDNYSVSRVRKVVSSTSLELYHGLTGFTTTLPAKVRRVTAGRRFSPRSIMRVGPEWWFYLTVWGVAGDDADIGALLEENYLYKHSGTTPAGSTPVIDRDAGTVTARNDYNGERSFENMGLLREPFAGLTMVNSASAAIALTGSDATFVVAASGYSLDCQQGSFAVTGADAITVVDRTLDAQLSSYSISGSDADLVYTTVGAYALDASPDSYAVTGAEAATTAGRALDAQPGTYTVGGADAGLVVAVPGAYVLDAQTATYSVTGSSATNVATRLLSVDPAAYAVTGTTASLFGEHSIAATAASYTVTGDAASVIADRLLASDPGTVVVTGVSASIGTVFDLEIDAAAGNVAVTGAVADLDFAPGLARLTTRGGRIRWNTTGRITQNKEGAVA